MKKIDFKELQKIELNILVYFDKFCRQNDLRYSLLGGTLLGAVRHKGFIPWDDDIDVMMPRSDYIKLCASFPNNEEYVLLNNSNNPKFGYMYAKIIDNRTIIDEKNTNRNNLVSGVFIDIFIYDGMGNTINSAKRKFNSSSFLRELLVASNWKKYFRSKTHSFLYEPARFLLYLASRFINQRKIIKRVEGKYKSLDFDKCNYVGNLCSDRRDKSIIKRSFFDDFIELEFETYKFMAFKGYETYLIAMYGDYMQLPPVENRFTHHTFDAYYKD